MKLGRQNITLREGIQEMAGDNKESGVRNHQPYLSLMLETCFFSFVLHKCNLAYIHSRRIVASPAGNKSGEETKLKKWVGLTWRWMLST